MTLPTLVIEWVPNQPLNDTEAATVKTWLRETHRDIQQEGTSFLAICRHENEAKATLVYAPSEEDYDAWLDENEDRFAETNLCALRTLH